MNDHGVTARWLTGDSVSRLSALLGLPTDPYMQDWEHECSDARRLGEFLDVYERGDLSEDDRFAMMALIVSSLDESLREGGAEQAILQRVRQHLLANFTLHKWTIHYWCLLDEPDPENVFHATPFMREIWRQRR